MPVVPDPEYPPLRIEQEYVDRLEGWCDHYNAELPTLRSFILNGGTPGAAQLHVARTVVRRAERAAWAAYDEHGQAMNKLAITYLNRLSDLLFILARYANRERVNAPWVPGGELRRPATEGRRVSDGKLVDDDTKTESKEPVDDLVTTHHTLRPRPGRSPTPRAPDGSCCARRTQGRRVQGCQAARRALAHGVRARRRRRDRAPGDLRVQRRPGSASVWLHLGLLGPRRVDWATRAR